MRARSYPPFVMALLASATLLAADEEDVTEPAEPGAWIRIVAPTPDPVRGSRSDDVVRRSDVTATYQASGETFPRTYSRSGKALEGTLVDVTEEVIVLDMLQDSRRVRVPRDAIVGFEVRTEPSRKKRGALIGALTGVGVALVVAAITQEPDKFLGGFGIQFGAAAFLAVPSGAAVGAIVAPGDQWAPGALASAGGFTVIARRLSFSVQLGF